jgi:hypothetical protein
MEHSGNSTSVAFAGTTNNSSRASMGVPTYYAFQVERLQHEASKQVEKKLIRILSNTTMSFALMQLAKKFGEKDPNDFVARITGLSCNDFDIKEFVDDHDSTLSQLESDIVPLSKKHIVVTVAAKEPEGVPSKSGADGQNENVRKMMISTNTTSLPRKRRKQDHASSLPVDSSEGDEESEDEDSDDEESEFCRLQRALASALHPHFSPDASPRRGAGLRKFSISKEIGSHHAKLLVELHDFVVKKTPGDVTWGEASSKIDPRRRCYAFLPGQRQRLLKLGIRVQRAQDTRSDDTSEHDRTMSQASIDLCWASADAATRSTRSSSRKQKINNGGCCVMMVPSSAMMYEALQAVTTHIQSLVPTKYQNFVTMESLVAVQPNHHNGARYLPAHLDFPRADGFGVVIATVAIRHTGGSQVVLVDDGDEGQDSLYWSFGLEDGDCYVLSGDARNKCLHGVLAEDGRRETLNFRYGLHSKEFAEEEVERHWPV